MPRLGKPGEIEVLSMFASVLRKAGIPSRRDDPYIEFDYKGRRWRVQHFHSTQKGISIKGREHNMDLVIWSDNDYVAYVEVKDQYKDLPPHLSREFVGRVLWKGVDDALFVSKRSTINRWQILDRYGIRNTDHLLEAKCTHFEYREWPEIVVKNFIENDLGNCRIKAALNHILPSRKQKTVELLKRHKAFNGIGFRFVDTQQEKTKYYYISDQDYVIHALYAIFIKDSTMFTVFQTDKKLNLANVYEVFGSSVDLGTDVTICMCPGFETSSAEDLFKEMGFLRMTELDVQSKFAVHIASLPLFKWVESVTYPLTNLIGTPENNMPPCIKKALGGVPDGLFETAILLQTVFKACSIPFDWKDFAEKCHKKIEEFWLSYEPSKTKKDTFEKISQAADLVLTRKIDPTSITCALDTSGVKGPKALDEIFHLKLCTPDATCGTLKEQEIYEYISRSLEHAQR